MDADISLSKIRSASLSYIGRREFCRADLTQKLIKRFPAPDLIEECLDWLEELDYLDDQRYAAMFLRSAVGRRRGPNRVKLEMQRKGLSAHHIEVAFVESEVDWFELALDRLQSKFHEPEQDFKERSKRYRYMQTQGFVGDQIQYALSNVSYQNSLAS